MARGWTVVGLLAVACAAAAGVKYGVEKTPPESPFGGVFARSAEPASRLDGRPGKAPETSAPSPHSTEAGETYEHFSVGMELLESGNPAQAIVRLNKARTLQPGKCSIHEALGRAYFGMGDWASAENEFRRIVELRPSDDYAHYCLSRSLARLGRSTEARTHLRLARALRPEHPRYSAFPL